MSPSCFICSSIDGHLGYFHILKIVNSTAMNIGVRVFFWISVLGSFGYVSQNGITRSKGRSIFNFLRYLHTAFRIGCTSLHSHPLCKRVPLSPSPHQHLLFAALLMIGILTGVKWYLILIFISLISGVEHPFICLLAIWIEVCIQVLHVFLIGLFGFWC